MNALKEVSAPVAAIIYSAEPLWGAGLAWGILGERCASLTTTPATCLDIITVRRSCRSVLSCSGINRRSDA